MPSDRKPPYMVLSKAQCWWLAFALVYLGVQLGAILAIVLVKTGRMT